MAIYGTFCNPFANAVDHARSNTAKGIQGNLERYLHAATLPNIPCNPLTARNIVPLSYFLSNPCTKRDHGIDT